MKMKTFHGRRKLAGRKFTGTKLERRGQAAFHPQADQADPGRSQTVCPATLMSIASSRLLDNAKAEPVFPALPDLPKTGFPGLEALRRSTIPSILTGSKRAGQAGDKPFPPSSTAPIHYYILFSYQ
jgi:hypothetical protein